MKNPYLTRVQTAKRLGISYRSLRIILKKGLLKEQGGSYQQKKICSWEVDLYLQIYPNGIPPRKTVPPTPYTPKRKQELLAELQALARERGGECLSAEYENNKAPLLWRCAEGHTWYSAANNVKHQETWCRICHLSNRPKPTGRKRQKRAGRQWVAAGGKRASFLTVSD